MGLIGILNKVVLGGGVGATVTLLTWIQVNIMLLQVFNEIRRACIGGTADMTAIFNERGLSFTSRRLVGEDHWIDIRYSVKVCWSFV